MQKKRVPSSLKAEPPASASPNVISPSSNSESNKRVAWGTPFTLVPASRLDMFDGESNICKSEFIGIANFACTVGMFYTLVVPGIRYYQGQTMFDFSLAKTMFDDVVLLMTTWFTFMIFTFSTFFLHKIHRSGVSLLICRILEYSCELLILIYPNILVWNRGWGVVPSCYILLCACVYMMKMHSYFETNLLYKAAEKEKNGENDSVYPKNLTVKNYVHFILCPSLVYESSFPRSKHGFRPYYLIAKTFQFFFFTALLYTLSVTTIIPAAVDSYHNSFFETFLKLLIPLSISDILMFGILFECICNMFAEITCFGDRSFYEDWWNSTGFDEMSRKWNKPVHEFLLRHVYLKSRLELKLSKEASSIVTFVYSALLHEMIMMTVFKLFAPYLFAFMMLQIPMIFFLSKYLKGRQYGNFAFWFCIIAGMPIISTLYCKTWMWTLNQGGAQTEKMLNLSFF